MDGCSWKVGQGTRIRAGLDRWVEGGVPVFKSNVCLADAMSWKVSHFLDPVSLQWDRHKVFRTFAMPTIIRFWLWSILLRGRRIFCFGLVPIEVCTLSSQDMPFYRSVLGFGWICKVFISVLTLIFLSSFGSFPFLRNVNFLFGISFIRVWLIKPL